MRVLWSAPARLESETLTIVASRLDIKEPITATAVIFQIRGCNPSARSEALGKRGDHQAFAGSKALRQGSGTSYILRSGVRGGRHANDKVRYIDEGVLFRTKLKRIHSLQDPLILGQVTELNVINRCGGRNSIISFELPSYPNVSIWSFPVRG